MACEKYTNCEYCRKDYHCSYDHIGNGSPWCREFQCTIDNCKRYECISYEEELFEMRGYWKENKYIWSIATILQFKNL